MERVRRRLPLEREQDLCLAKEREFVGGGQPHCHCVAVSERLLPGGYMPVHCSHVTPQRDKAQL